MSLGIRLKDPQETRLFTLDWTLDLDGATISTSDWTVPTGLTRVSQAIVSGNLKTTVLISGGTADVDYTVTNTVTTSDSQTLERSGTVAVRQL